MAREQIEISIIGSVQARIAGQAVHVPRGRPRILLAALALEAGRPVAVTRLMDYLWGDALPENPRASLQNLVRRLRQLIGAEAIRTFPEGYLLDVPADQVDVKRFFRLADELAGCPSDETERRRALIDAMLALWQDEPLADVGSSTLVREHTSALFERYLAMVEARADADIAQGHQTRAIGNLRELTARLPLHESLWARLLRVLRDTGRVAEALDTYERLRGILADELGADPSPPLQELHRDLLNASVSTNSTPDSPAPATSAATAASTEAPADGPNAEPEPPRQLPPEPAGFVGRSSEVATLDGTLHRWQATEQARSTMPICLAVLHGQGGVGKTSLAVRWAHRVSPDFPDGQLYVDLQGFGPSPPLEPHLVLGMLLRSFGVPAESIPTHTSERSALFRTRTAERRILLVLDNASDEEQVRPLLPGTAAMVLVTSRNRLRDLSIREGAVGIALEQFGDQDARSLIEGILGPERIAASAQGLDDLLELCGGLPLALRVAAEMCSRYPDTAMDELVADLGKPTDGPGPLTEGLRSVFAWSCRGLSPAAERAFRRLGRFPGRTIGTQAAAVLLEEDRRTTAELLDTLVTVHLVEEPQRGRYWMHDLTRAYATERFDTEEEPAERSAMWKRLLDWYLHAASAANTALGHSAAFTLIGEVGPPYRDVPELADQAAALRWFETERESLLALLTEATEQEYDDHAWQLCRAMRDFLSSSNYLDDLLNSAKLALTAAERTGNPEAIGYSAFALGGACNHVGQHDLAEQVLQRSLRAERERADDSRIANVLSVLGLNRDEAGDYAGSLAYHDDAVATAERSGSERVLAHTLLNSGCGAIGAGDLDKAVRQTEQALQWYEAARRPLQHAIALGNLAAAYRYRRELESALDYGERALTILRELGDRKFTAITLTELGTIHALADRPDRATEAWQQALSLTNPYAPEATTIRSKLAELHQPTG